MLICYVSINHMYIVGYSVIMILLFWDGKYVSVASSQL